MNQIEQLGEWQLTGSESYGSTGRLWAGRIGGAD